MHQGNNKAEWVTVAVAFLGSAMAEAGKTLSFPLCISHLVEMVENWNGKREGEGGHSWRTVFLLCPLSIPTVLPVVSPDEGPGLIVPCSAALPQ